MIRKPRVLAAAATAVLAVACGSTSGDGGSSASDYPSQTLQWTVAFGPGGGNDIMSRTIVDILKREGLYPADISVVNREGGSGARGWGYLFSQRGDPYHISTTSGSFITTPLQADTGWTYADFTPVGLFARDDLIFLVSSESGWGTWEDWVAHAKSAGDIAVGGIGTVNVDFIHHSLLAEQAGYKISYVPFDDEGQLITALLSGSVQAIVSNPAEVLGQIDSGDMVPLMFSGDEPLTTLPDVPTAESLGYEGLPAMPRGLILAPDAPKEAQQWWIDTMKKVVETPEWQEYVTKNQLTPDVRWGEDFMAALEETTTRFETVLREQGALEE